jgi:hypothetical protein
MIRGLWKIVVPLITALVVVIGLFFLLERPPNAAELKPDELLRRGGKAFRDYTVDGEQKVTVYRDGKAVESKEFPSPIEPWLHEKLKENGAMFPGAKVMAYKYLAEMSKRLDIDEEFLTHHSVKMLGPVKVAGRWAWDLEVRPNIEDAGYFTIALDNETGYPLRREKYSWRGEKENSIEFTQVRGYEKRRPPPPLVKPPPEPPGGIPRQEPPGGKPPRDMPGGRTQSGNPIDRPGMPRPGFGPGRNIQEHGFVPPEELKKRVADGTIPYPSHIPPGYSFKGARKFPGGPRGHGERLQLIFSDGINAFSIFMIHLPPFIQDEARSEEFIQDKLRELHTAFPDGFAMKKTDRGLLVGVGDISPEILDEVLQSVTKFDGHQPLWPDGSPPDPEELF